MRTIFCTFCNVPVTLNAQRSSQAPQLYRTYVQLISVHVPTRECSIFLRFHQHLGMSHPKNVCFHEQHPSEQLSVSKRKRFYFRLVQRALCVNGEMKPISRPSCWVNEFLFTCRLNLLVGISIFAAKRAGICSF